MSKTYKYSGLTEELYQRLVSEHEALKKAHKKALISSFFKMLEDAANYKLASYIKHSTPQWWSVRGYRPKLSTD